MTERRQEAERQVELVRADQVEFTTFFGSLEDLLDLNFRRAEEERREKERLGQEIDSLRRQNDSLRQQVYTLQQTLALNQSQ